MFQLSALRAAAYLPPVLRARLTAQLQRRLGPALALDPEDFRDQRVLILGPARTLQEDLRDIPPAGFDLIVKMNNGLDTPVDLPGLVPLRCDVLFHSLGEDARPVTCDKLRAAGVRWLVHRTPKRSAFLRTAMAHAEHGGTLRVRHIDHHAYSSCASDLQGCSPTTGLMAALFFLNAPIRELGIVGFTFFSTAYLPGYDDKVCSDAAARERVLSCGHHAPVEEARMLARCVEAARGAGKTVTLGRHVLLAMQSHCGPDRPCPRA